MSIPRSGGKMSIARIKLRGDLGQNARDIARERTPDFEVKGVRPRAPQRDVCLGKDRARAHAHRELREVQIERAGAAEDGRGMGSGYVECELPMTDVDQRVWDIGHRSF